MAFKTLFLAHYPFELSGSDTCSIKQAKYELTVKLVKDQSQAKKVAKQMVSTAGIQSILLCPGFTHAEVAEIAQLVKGQAGVCVARCDGPSNRFTVEVMQQEGWFGNH